MGDRANVAFIQDWPKGTTERVYLYTHWGGYRLPALVRRVLARKERWDDPSYLTRMVFSAMVKDSIDEPTGFGIATRVLDNEYPVLVLDCKASLIWQEEEEDGGSTDGKPINVMTFADFVKLTPETAEKHGYRS